MKIIPCLIAATLLASAPAVAHADTPAPVPTMDLADTPLKTSGHTITGTNADWGLDWFTLAFHATTKTAILQISTQPATADKQGRYSMGATQPIALTGASGSDPTSLTLPGHTYAFSQHVQGLQQGTTYHFLITAPVKPGFKPVQVVGSIRTEQHGEHMIVRRASGLDLEFTASAASATVSVSTSPVVQGSRLKGSTPVLIKGQPVSGLYRFTHAFDNLTPGTEYYVLVVPGSTKATPCVTATSTKTRQIEVTVEKIRVIDDADKGLLGKGDLLFQVRGTDTPDGSTLWGSHYGETKLGSGQTVNLAESAKAPRHTFTSKQSAVTVQVEGRESDWVTRSARQLCEHAYNQPHEKHKARWLNKADSGANCYQFSYAQTTFDLTKGALQTRTFTVARSPELRFEVTVRMVVTAV